MTTPDPQAMRKRMLALDACAVSDALDQLGLPGAIGAIPTQTGPARIWGRVATVELGAPRPDTPSSHLGTATIVASEPGDVIVVAHRGRVDCAGWGGNLSRAARVKGVSGVIVDGACRDIDEAREIGFPVFARAATTVTARGRVAERSHGEPVVIDNVRVEPGDYVIADGSGVVFVPSGRALEIVEAAEAIARKEAAMAERIEAGDPVDQVMGASYENMLASSDDEKEIKRDG